MNHDEPNLQAWIEPELEARIVAAVLGEASAFEQAELERLAAEKPELGIFRRRIEAVHGLLGQALRPEQAPMRLAPERRGKLLQTIGATPVAAEPDKHEVLRAELSAARRKRRINWYWRYGLASAIPIAAVLMIVLMPVNERKAARKSAELAQMSVPVEMPKLELPAPEEAEPEAPAVTFTERSDATNPADRVSLGTRRINIDASLRAAQSEAIASHDRRRENRQVDMAAAAADHLTQEQKSRLSAQAFQPAPAFESPSVHNYSPPAAGLNAAKSHLPNPNISLGFPAGSVRGRSISYGAVVGASTQLKDVSSAISVVSRELLKDAAATSARQSLAYANASQPAKQDFTADLPARTDIDPSTGESISVMSPFEVSAPSEAGYTANSTLAGTRLIAPAPSLLAQVKAPDSPESVLGAKVAAANLARYSGAGSRALDDGFIGGDVAASGSAKPAAVPAVSAPSSNAAVEDKDLSEKKAADAPLAPPLPVTAPADAEISTAKDAISTFSLHVSDASFRIAQAALARGEMPDPAQIRPEEFYNAFDYGDPAPAKGERIACRIEQSAHPFLQQRNLVRITMQVAASGRSAGQPLHLTVLLDTSGSMERDDRTASVHRALTVLASLLGAHDRVTLVGFARQPRLLAENLAGDAAAQLVQLADHTPFTGGTNMEEALKLAGELALRHRDPAAQNRIVMITDGAANLGNADPAQLAARIEMLRQQGIAFDACGIGTDGLDDTMLEALTRKGDGRYYVIDRPEGADTNFARQLAGAFRPAAQNVKVQVRFNPARVARYRLIGFEQHRLNTEDFRNDRVDAAELAADEAAVALYQVEVLPQGEGELGDVFVRFRDTATGTMVERSWTMLHEPKAEPFDRAPASLQLAGAAAALAEKLRGGEQAKRIDLNQLAPVVNALRGHYAGNARVQELVTMFEQARRATAR